MNGGNTAALIAEIFSHPDLKGGLDIAGKTTIIYFFLVAGLRLLGKRELGQMNIYDLVLIIVLANAVQNAMVGQDSTLVGGIVAAITLLMWNKLFNLLLARSKRVERLMVGGPILIVNHGHMLTDRMQRQGVTQDQVMAALREHGIDDVEKVRLGVLEVDGSISIVPSDSATFRTRRHFKQLRMP